MPDAGASFVGGFAAAWDRPHPDRFLELFQPEIRLVAPLTPATVGVDEARQVFGELLRLLPGLRGDVHDWAPHPDGVFIHFTLSGKLGGRAVSWRAVDRFTLRDGLATERVSYFDSLPLLADAIRLPLLWPRLLRSGVRPRPGGGGPEDRPPAWSLPPGDTEGAAERFAAAYGAHLAAPTAESLVALLDVDARVEIPGLTPIGGGESARRAIARLLALLPDLRGTPLRLARREQTIFLESERSATVGRRLLRWRLVERHELRGARVARGSLFFDTVPHAAALALSPRVARRWSRSGLLALRRASDQRGDAP